VVLALNTVRIASLGHAAAEPALFHVLHRQVWPLILFTAALGYALLWMRAQSDRQAGVSDARRFGATAAVLVVLFALSAPWIVRSETLRHAGASLARVAAFLLSWAGATATASAGVLSTRRGAFVVTPECLATPLIPLYAAGVLGLRWSWRRRALALAVMPPLFAALALGRLLILAVPPVVTSSPLLLVHGFHQLVLAVAAVAVFALAREPAAPGRWMRACRRASAALAVALLAAVAAGAALNAALPRAARALDAIAPHAIVELVEPGDAQGALALLPAFQAGLLAALGIVAAPGWRAVVLGFAALLASQVALLALMGELAVHAGLLAHALVVRAWAVGAPVVLAMLLFRVTPLPEAVPHAAAVDGVS
jgi:hypothetical protein